MSAIHTCTRQKETRRKIKEAISTQVPDMARGFTITTLQGEINIDAEFAKPFQQLTLEVLALQLKRANQNATEA